MLWPSLLVLMYYTVWQMFKLYLVVLADVIPTVVDRIATVTHIVPRV